MQWRRSSRRKEGRRWHIWPRRKRSKMPMAMSTREQRTSSSRSKVFCKVRSYRCHASSSTRSLVAKQHNRVFTCFVSLSDALEPFQTVSTVQVLTHPSAPALIRPVSPSFQATPETPPGWAFWYQPRSRKDIHAPHLDWRVLHRLLDLPNIDTLIRTGRSQSLARWRE